MSSRGSRSSWQLKQGRRLRDNSRRMQRGNASVKGKSWSFRDKRKPKRECELRKKRSLRGKSRKRRRHERQLRRASANASSKRNCNNRGRMNCGSKRSLEEEHLHQLALSHNSLEVPERWRLAQPPLAPSLPSVTFLSFQGGQTLRVVFRMLTSSRLQQVLLPLEKFADPICCQLGRLLALVLSSVMFGGLQDHLHN